MDGYGLFLLVGGCLVLYVFLSSSLIVMVLSIIFYSIVWLFLMIWMNYFVWGSLLTLLYLGGMMVLFTYSIILTGVVGGEFKLSISSGERVVFLFLCFLGVFYRVSVRNLRVSSDDQVFHFYSGVFVILSGVILVSILFFCIVELVEDYL